MTPTEKRLNDFGIKVMQLMDQENEQEGLFGVALGVGIGGLIGQGCTAQEVREMFDKTLEKVLLIRTQQIS